MKTQKVVVLVVAVCVLSIVLTYLFTRPVPAAKQVVSEPNIPQAAAAPKPAVDKQKVLAILNDRTETQRKNAIAAFKKVMRDEPPYIIKGTKGYPVAREGQYEKAVQISQQEISENPEIVGPRYTLAWIYAKTASYDQAITVCKDALARGDFFNGVRYVMGWVYAKQGKYEDALKVCDDALRIEPYSAMLFYSKGRIQELFGRSDEAIASYKKAIELQSDFCDAYVFLGLLYTELGSYEQAVNTQKQAINCNRYSPGGYLGLGLAYDEMGNYQSALAQLQKAVTLGTYGTDVDSPNQPLSQSIGIDDAVLFNRIGILQIRLGSYQDALAAFNRSIAARPDFAEPYRGLALVNLLIDDKDAAQKSFEKLQNTDAELAKTVADLFNQVR